MNQLTSTWEFVPLGDIAPAIGNRMPDDNKSVWNLSLEDIEANTGKVISKVYCRVDSLSALEFASVGDACRDMEKPPSRGILNSEFRRPRHKESLCINRTYKTRISGPWCP